MTVKSLQQYALELKRLGKGDFRQQYGRPALIGLGMIAGVDNKTRIRETGTLTMGRLEPEVIPSSVVGRVWLITKGPEGPLCPAVTAGRSAYNDIVIPEYTISNRHCQFSYEPGRILVTDLGSHNGTYLNGLRLSEGQRAKMQPHDQLGLGRLLFGYISAAEFLSSVETLAA